MDPERKKASKRINKLRSVINKHRYLYHVLDKPEISDEALDSLKHELKNLEDKYPELITSDSPTQRVSGKPLDKFSKVNHTVRMLSLEDVFSFEEFTEWENRIEKLANTSNIEYFGEIKFDGLALSLTYKDGILIRGATRGDGKVGEDVTGNIRTIESVPLIIKSFNGDNKSLEKGEIEIRGEIVMTKKAFKKVNKEQEKKGEKTYANTRNLAAGSIRQLDPKIASERKLEFYAYDIATEVNVETHSKEHEVLKDLGFKTDSMATCLKNHNEILKFYSNVDKKREKLEHEIDGVVIAVNKNDLFSNLGVVGKAPRGAIAFKFAPVEVTTILKDIIVQVGRTGAVTPVAILEPADIGGVTVSRASLHNIDEINRLDARIGDTVIVGRAGDVIPDVREVVKDLRTGKEKKFIMPSQCPVCGEKLVRDEGGVAWRCVNTECRARKREQLYYFVSRKAFDIEGLGPSTIDTLLDQGLIQDASDIFILKEGDLIPLERLGEKSASNIIQSINDSKSVTFPKFIMSLGILHVGEETAIDLANYFGSLEGLKKAKKEELESINNIGEVVARSIYDYFRDKRNTFVLERLIKNGVRVQAVRQKSSSILSGKSFVFTGEMTRMTREAAKNEVRKLGGAVSESVSSKTSYVVSGKNPGSKLDKAKKLDIRVIGENEFLAIIKQ